MHKLSCHCGNIQIEIAQEIDLLTQCTCSICRRYAGLWAYCTSKTTVVSIGPDGAKAYLWNDKEIEFYHCSICGCITHYKNADKSGEYRVAVNTRMMSSSDLSGIKVKTFDGADTWRYIDAE